MKKDVPRCKKCHRELTDPRSIEREYGPECWDKLTDEEKQKEVEEKMPEIEYDGGDIICRRERGKPVVNIPQKIKHHSPAGFEWGYGGSGPADLALNILALFIGKQHAFDLHQQFKNEFIANMPRSGGIIIKEEILTWVEENLMHVKIEA